jgi:hypothetical protein
MSHTFQCGDSTALVGYLYGESEPAERAAIDSHVTLCAACAAELAALESARLQLASWTPPEADLGFVISRAQASGPRAEPASGPRSSGAWRLGPGAWYRQPLPAWAQAVAACLLFAAGLSLGVGTGTVRGVVGGAVGGAVDGAVPAASPGVATTGGAPAAAPTAATPTELAALERRLRAEMAQLRTTAANPRDAGPQTISEAQVLARVRALIEESEQRQQRELALRTAQVVRDFDSQRRVDLAQIQRSFGQIEGLTGAEVREQRQLLNYLMRVSEQR